MDAVILDLDGVVTRTATVHAEAWRRVFDDVLCRHAVATGVPFHPFDPELDYRQYVDGKPREEGARDFFAARGVVLDGEQPGVEAPLPDSLQDVARRKNDAFHTLIEERGVPLVGGAAVQLRRWRERGVPLALVTSSRNAAAVLDRAGLHDSFDVIVDGVTAGELQLPGKPEPDTFLEAARRLGVPPARAAVVEDAVAGVEAARRGGFGHVVGMIDEASEHAAADARRLKEHGADIVVGDLRELDEVLDIGAAVQRTRSGSRNNSDLRQEESARSGR